MRNKKNIHLIFINAVCVLALIVVVFPLLVIAQYNYPSADDWSYGAGGYSVIKNGGGLFSVLKVSLDTVWQTYMNVEGRFVGIFYATLQPGIWGEQYYVIVTWILLGAVIISELFLFKSILCVGCRKENRWLWFPIVAPTLVMQILYCPFPEESFYWYTGSMYYTFSYALSLILLVLFWRLGIKQHKGWRYVLNAIVASVLAVQVGGANFGTSLSSFLTLCMLLMFLWIYDRRAVARTWFVTVLSGASLMLCVFAPGNTNRINGNFGGETEGVVEAIWMSLVRSFTNIYSWTSIKVILLLIFILPFVWKSVKNIDWKFKLPGVFTLLSFGLYASQSTATMYVDGTTGGGRMAAILLYSYYVWLVANLIYWLGWLSKTQNMVQSVLNRIQNKFEKMLIPYCAFIGITIVVLIYISDLKGLTSYRAYRSLRQGWAQQYAAEWDARLDVLHDDMVKKVEFAPLSVYPEVIMYTDLQDENGHIWVNVACADYYGKEAISVVVPENE